MFFVVIVAPSTINDLFRTYVVFVSVPSTLFEPAAKVIDAMALKSETNDNEYCPVCRTLPWYDIPAELQTAKLEFHIDDTVMMQLMTPQTDKRFSTECGLYSLVRSLRDVWSGKKELPTDTKWDMQPTQTYCPGPEREFKLFAEPNSTMGKTTVLLHI